MDRLIVHVTTGL